MVKRRVNLKNIKNLFIAGTPKVGKTSLIKEVAHSYKGRVGGFFTEEIRHENVREGFRLRTFDGQDGILASKSLKSEFKVGKYGIDLCVMDDLAVPSLQRALDACELIVVDEIGAMEVLSESFRRKLVECLNASQNVLASIRLGAQPFTDEIKCFPHSNTLVLSRENYHVVRKKVLQWLEETLGRSK